LFRRTSPPNPLSFQERGEFVIPAKAGIYKKISHSVLLPLLEGEGWGEV